MRRIAKSWALDACARTLGERGISRFLLYAGGQVYASGRKAEGPWRAGIQDPRGEPGDLFATLDVEDASLSTSGDYEHFFVNDGARYHHIIDLATGYPATRTRSATVLARSATLADAYSTACFVLEPERALALAQAEGFELVPVDADGKVHTTPGLGARLQLRHPPLPSTPERPDTARLPVPR